MLLTDIMTFDGMQSLTVVMRCYTSMLVINILLCDANLLLI